MYFKTTSNNSFSSSFPIQIEYFKEQFSQVLKQEYNPEGDNNSYIGKMVNDLITRKKPIVDKAGGRIMVEINAKLVQKEADLLIETSIEPRKFRFSERSAYASFMVCFYLATMGLISLLFIYSAITKSEPQYLLFFIWFPIGWLLGTLQLSSIKKRALIITTEELKKEFELAYLRARSS